MNDDKKQVERFKIPRRDLRRHRQGHDMNNIRWGSLLMACICMVTASFGDIPQWAAWAAYFAAGSWFQSFAASVDDRQERLK